MDRFKFDCGFESSTDDCEKLVTPGIIYVHKESEIVDGHYIAIGWWHYSFFIFIGILKKSK